MYLSLYLFRDSSWELTIKLKLLKLMLLLAVSVGCWFCLTNFLLLFLF